MITSAVIGLNMCLVDMRFAKLLWSLLKNNNAKDLMTTGLKNSFGSTGYSLFSNGPLLKV